MVTVYLLIEDGYVSAWSSTPSGTPNEICIEVEGDHEVIQNPEVFKIVDGELVKDEERQQQLIDGNKEKPSETELLREENEKLREEIDMNALAFMEFAEIILGGGSE